MAAKIQTELITVARAAENRIFLLTANRVGTERWAEFCGWSQIVDPYGVRLAEAGETEETLLVADIDVEKARDKDFVIPGEYELYLFGHRRPELYGDLVAETRLADARRPTRTRAAARAAPVRPAPGRARRSLRGGAAPPSRTHPAAAFG